MKKVIVLISLVFFITSAIAQTPQAFKYQAVARDSSGKVLHNKNLSLKISILSGSITGTVVYSETHSSITNQFGLFTLNIGKGSPTTGVFANIDWGSNSHFVQIELDPKGGTNYQHMSTSQLLSVPYALYAGKAGNVVNSDTSSTNEIQDLQLSKSNVLTITKNNTATNINLQPFYDNTDGQVLSIRGDTISISNGNSIFFKDDVIDSDSDSTNELQVLSIKGDTISISNGNSIFFEDDVIDSDSDSTNELQTLSISGNKLQISKGNYVTFSGTVDLDSDPTNEIQVISISNDTIFLSNGGQIKLPSSFSSGLDKEIRLMITAGGFSVMSDTVGLIIKDKLIDFNKNNYSNIDSIIFATKGRTGDTSCILYIELWDLTNNLPIAKSRLSTNLAGTDFEYLRSGNLINSIPKTTIDIGIKISLNKAGTCFGVIGTSWLFLKRK